MADDDPPTQETAVEAARIYLPRVEEQVRDAESARPQRERAEGEVQARDSEDVKKRKKETRAIKKIKEAEEFTNYYKNKIIPFLKAIDNYLRETKGKERLSAIQDWAEVMSDSSSEDYERAEEADTNRVLCLRFVKQVCDTAEKESVSYDRRFDRRDLHRILQTILPMDKANCLLVYGGLWYSSGFAKDGKERDVESDQSKELRDIQKWTKAIENYKPTRGKKRGGHISGKVLRLVCHSGNGFPDLKCWLRPALPLHFVGRRDWQDVIHLISSVLTLVWFFVLLLLPAAMNMGCQLKDITTQNNTTALNNTTQNNTTLNNTTVNSTILNNTILNNNTLNNITLNNTNEASGNIHEESSMVCTSPCNCQDPIRTGVLLYSLALYPLNGMVRKAVCRFSCYPMVMPVLAFVLAYWVDNITEKKWKAFCFAICQLVGAVNLIIIDPSLTIIDPSDLGAYLAGILLALGEALPEKFDPLTKDFGSTAWNFVMACVGCMCAFGVAKVYNFPLKEDETVKVRFLVAVASVTGFDWLRFDRLPRPWPEMIVLIVCNIIWILCLIHSARWFIRDLFLEVYDYKQFKPSKEKAE